jgi:predicted Zn-dependent protease
MGLNTDEYYDVIKDSELYLDRAMEKEADQTAVNLTLEKYGRTGEYAIKYFVLLMQMVETLKGAPPEYLCTHPHWSTRYAYINKMIYSYWH